MLNSVPVELRSAPSQGDATSWVTDPTGMRRLCDAAVRRLIAMPADTPSLRLIADQTARLLAGLSDVLDGLALLVADPARHQGHGRHAKLHVPDWLPALVNAGRAFVTIGAVEVFLGYHRMAERRVGHHLYGDFGHHLCAKSRCGLRGSYELHGGGRPCRGLRRNHWICGLAECRDLRRLRYRDRELF